MEAVVHKAAKHCQQWLPTSVNAVYTYFKTFIFIYLIMNDARDNFFIVVRQVCANNGEEWHNADMCLGYITNCKYVLFKYVNIRSTCVCVYLCVCNDTSTCMGL